MTDSMMTHTWKVVDEGGEPVLVTLTCMRDEVIEAPLDVQYLIDLLNNAKETPTSDYLFH